MFEDYANVDTPVTQKRWRKLSEGERLNLVKEKIDENEEFGMIRPTRANEAGQVIIALSEGLPARKRGGLLLTFERSLKDSVDQGINVWCEPIGDKSSLRNLRGIEMGS